MFVFKGVSFCNSGISVKCMVSSASAPLSLEVHSEGEKGACRVVSRHQLLFVDAKAEWRVASVDVDSEPPAQKLKTRLDPPTDDPEPALKSKHTLC